MGRASKDHYPRSLLVQLALSARHLRRLHFTRSVNTTNVVTRAWTLLGVIPEGVWRKPVRYASSLVLRPINTGEAIAFAKQILKLKSLKRLPQCSSKRSS